MHQDTQTSTHPQTACSTKLTKEYICTIHRVSSTRIFHWRICIAIHQARHLVKQILLWFCHGPTSVPWKSREATNVVEGSRLFLRAIFHEEFTKDDKARRYVAARGKNKFHFAPTLGCESRFTIHRFIHMEKQASPLDDEQFRSNKKIISHAFIHRTRHLPRLIPVSGFSIAALLKRIAIFKIRLTSRVPCFVLFLALPFSLCWRYVWKRRDCTLPN